ncbi:hypothetical protein FRX31_026719 [Thalictrum thalictroides]|uniref:F-box associated beta-propeller type 3 domain-containing protein n=1 Tax=Thalictrum thalictroides TaxID=46969 RepID=A0A7J6VF15_THATH|nr:hypothetical protein FRX31_026719 [Thalictrum thalictroides]
MNGVIHWRNRSYSSNKDEVIVAFDFTEEKFSVIPLPESIVQGIAQRPISGCVTRSILCTTMEGHLAITNSKVGISEPLIFWILKDSSKQVWIKKAFSRPSYMNQELCRAIGTLPTGEVIIKPAKNSHQCWLYYYDVTNNTSRKVEFTGLPSQEYYPGVRTGYNVLYHGFVESLYF